MQNIFTELLFIDNQNSSTIPQEIFDLETPGDRSETIVNFKINIVNQNIFNTLSYTGSNFLNSSFSTINNSYYYGGYFTGQDYINTNGKIEKIEERDKFYFRFNQYGTIKSTAGEINQENNLTNTMTSTVGAFFIGPFDRAFQANQNINAIIYEYSVIQTVINIFIFIFIFLGIIICFLVINKSFNKNIKQIGVLKALGYSQSSIAFGISFKILIILLIGFSLTIILLPLFLTIWFSFVGSSVVFSVTYFYISKTALIYGILLIIGAFWIFSFVILRLFFVSQSSINLINAKNQNKPNFILKTKSYNKSDLSFSNKLKINFSTRNIRKSFVLLFASISITFFTVVAFASSLTLQDTMISISDDFKYKSISAYKNSRNSISGSTDSVFATLSEEEFINGINNNTITDYDFDRENIPENINWEESSQQFLSNFNQYIWRYFEEEAVSAQNLKYISNESYLWINEILDIGNNFYLSNADNKNDPDWNNFLIFNNFIQSINYKT